MEQIKPGLELGLPPAEIGCDTPPSSPSSTSKGPLFLMLAILFGTNLVWNWLLFGSIVPGETLFANGGSASPGSDDCMSIRGTIIALTSLASPLVAGIIAYFFTLRRTVVVGCIVMLLGMGPLFIVSQWAVVCAVGIVQLGSLVATFGVSLMLVRTYFSRYFWAFIGFICILDVVTGLSTLLSTSSAFHMHDEIPTLFKIRAAPLLAGVLTLVTVIFSYYLPRGFAESGTAQRQLGSRTVFRALGTVLLLAFIYRLMFHARQSVHSFGLNPLNPEDAYHYFAFTTGISLLGFSILVSFMVVLRKRRFTFAGLISFSAMLLSLMSATFVLAILHLAEVVPSVVHNLLFFGPDAIIEVSAMVFLCAGGIRKTAVVRYFAIRGGTWVVAHIARWITQSSPPLDAPTLYAVIFGIAGLLSAAVATYCLVFSREEGTEAA